jgi:hypothetical protein
MSTAKAVASAAQYARERLGSVQEAGFVSIKDSPVSRTWPMSGGHERPGAVKWTALSLAANCGRWNPPPHRRTSSSCWRLMQPTRVWDRPNLLRCVGPKQIRTAGFIVGRPTVAPISLISTKSELPDCRLLWYHTDMSTVSYLDRFLQPVTEAFTPELARVLVELRADDALQAEIELLRNKANTATLSPDEEAAYKDFVEAVDVISILQSKARSYLARQPD